MTELSQLIYEPWGTVPARPGPTAARRGTAPLRVLAMGGVGPWGPGLSTLGAMAFSGEASTPEVPMVPGFVASTFNPLLYEAARQCLTAHPGDGSRTAVVLASVMGDATTSDLASQLMAAGQVHNPLLFMQATPNSVLGYLSREFGITGPLTCLSVRDGLAGELLHTAELVLEDPDVDRVLVLGVELLANERTRRAYQVLTASGSPIEAPSSDIAVAALLGKPTSSPCLVVSLAGKEDHGVAPVFAHTIGSYGSMRGLVRLAAAYAHLTRRGSGSALVPDPTAPGEHALIHLTYVTTGKGPHS